MLTVFSCHSNQQTNFIFDRTGVIQFIDDLNSKKYFVAPAQTFYKSWTPNVHMGFPPICSLTKMARKDPPTYRIPSINFGSASGRYTVFQSKFILFSKYTKYLNSTSVFYDTNLIYILKFFISLTGL